MSPFGRPRGRRPCVALHGVHARLAALCCMNEAPTLLSSLLRICVPDVRGSPCAVLNRLHLQALLALGCMEHRGACSADGTSGDGAGIMTAVPWGLYKAELPDLDLHEKTTG